MHARDAFIRELFRATPFVAHLGIEVEEVAAGRVVAGMAVRPEHLQQNGYVHAGALATLADHTAGGAAATAAPDGHGVLSIEFKVNLLRPAVGERLRCVAAVLKAGRTVSVVESEVFALQGGEAVLVSKATVTLMLVPWTPAA
jgi:uncharacterized protein (TIGR00369 family)